MKPLSTIALLSLLSYSQSYAIGENAPQPKGNTNSTELKTSSANNSDNPLKLHPQYGLLQQLSDPSYTKREEATKQLWELGEEGLPLLKFAFRSDDPERSKRAEILIRNIESGVLPTTDKNVIKAIDAYRAASTTQGKLKAIDTLIELKARKQVLYLLHWEENDAMKAEISRNRKLRSVALAAAHEALAEDNIDDAIALLRIAPHETFNMRALAHLLLHTGGIDKELLSIDPKSPEATDWKLILLKAKGDLPALKQFAQQEQLKPTLATIALLEGNASPILEHFKKESNDASQRIILDTLTRHFQKRDQQEARDVIEKLAEQLDEEASDGSDAEYIARNAMFFGFRDIGEKIIAKYDKEEAIKYFASQEYSDKEFALYGAPDPSKDAEAFEKWLSKEIKRELDGDLALLEENESSIELIATFYLERGEVARAMQVLNPLLAALEKDGDDRWFNILELLYLNGAQDSMVSTLVERGNEDEHYRLLCNHLFGDVQETADLWKAIDKLYPDANSEDQLFRFLSLMGTAGAKKAEFPHLKLQQAIYDDAERIGGTTLRSATEILAFAAEVRSDSTSALRFYKELCKDVEYAERKNFDEKYRQAAEAQFNYQEIINSYDLVPSAYKNSPTRLARYAMALRKLGKSDEAERVLEKSLVRTLGTTKLVNAVAGVMHEFGYRQEAHALWLNTLLSLSPSEWDFFYTLNYINNQSHYAMRSQQWKLANALKLAEIAIFTEPSMRPVSSYLTLRSGFTANFTYGMSLMEQGKVADATEILGSAHDSLIGDGTLADDFFPALLKTPLQDEADQWFEASWRHVEKEIHAYPNDHNAKNTAAWLGSRAVRRLDASLTHARNAVKLRPNQPAYIDTLAETYFAKGDRKKAMKNSQAALDSISNGLGLTPTSLDRSYSMYSELLDQHRRFTKDPFPSSNE
ncbi:hypothetical protein [Rubritalea tangerina]|uniref:Tetratricopeptide repeat protein n=1 Tax=Rubritalea tangerina TaxID=430798 RepID=A0ABW4Z9B5_9BACT